MALTENVPYFRPGAEVTAQATADVAVNTFVKIVAGGTGSRPHVAPAAAGDLAFGIAGRSAVEGEAVRIVRGGIAPAIAGETIEAGAVLYVGEGGKASSTGTANPVGSSTADAEADGYVPVALNL